MYRVFSSVFLALRRYDKNNSSVEVADFHIPRAHEMQCSNYMFGFHFKLNALSVLTAGLSTSSFTFTSVNFREVKSVHLSPDKQRKFLEDNLVVSVKQAQVNTGNECPHCC